MHTLRMALTLAVAGTTLFVSLTGSALAGASARASSTSTVNLTFIYNDLSILATEHLAPSNGNILGDVTDIVSYLNSHGGLGGHRIKLTSYKMPSLTGSAATDQAACLAATEQDHAEIVLIGNAVDDAVAQCVAVQHKTLTIVGDGPALSIFQQADGRLFAAGSNVAIDAQRLARTTASVAASSGYLTNKKVGVIVQGVPEAQAVVSDALVPTLRRLGHKVVAEATVPFPTGAETCSETAPAIQVMKQAGVNVVFLAAYDLCAVAVVTAAKQDDYQPQWITNSDNTTDTVSQFFAPVKDNWNGALGINQSFPASTAAAHCVRQALVPKGLNYAPSSDAYGIATQACIQLDDIATALDKVGSKFSNQSMISALETETDQLSNGGPAGTWSASKHDSGDWVNVVRYGASAGKMLPINNKFVRVPCPCAP
jgi:hypothetical protein